MIQIPILLSAATLGAGIAACSAQTPSRYAPSPWVEGRDAERAPFAPRASPDHVVVMVGDSAGRQERRVVRRHGDWARIEQSDIHGTSAYLVSLTAPLAVSFDQGEDGRYTRLFMRAASGGPTSSDAARPTGEVDHLLGESCTVWDITSRVMSYPSDAWWLSCITDDGIELWQRYENPRGYRSERRAISLVREPVAAELVTPPPDLLDPGRWATDPLPESGEGSIVDMDNKRTDRFRVEKRFTRLGSLQRLEDHSGFVVTSSAAPFHLRFERDSEGRYVLLTMSSEEPSIPMAPPVPAEDAPLLIAGERCEWLYMTPGLHDYARFDCRTADGDLLAERTHVRGSRTVLEARQTVRRRLSAADVIPPPEVLDPANWALR
ncbi:hypothetical protein GCM10009422_12460 [Brevundimonas kwangchunensis]|uniref:Lipoprotein n=1 Tax=Brevundimonas kwangchunensis TaxID=322163 RepID=A0ABN1GSX3_9CAUL